MVVPTRRNSGSKLSAQIPWATLWVSKAWAHCCSRTAGRACSVALCAHDGTITGSFSVTVVEIRSGVVVIEYGVGGPAIVATQTKLGSGFSAFKKVTSSPRRVSLPVGVSLDTQPMRLVAEP